MIKYFSDFQEIFAIKVDSCQRSRRILDIFCIPKFLGDWGRAFQKLFARYHPCLAARRLKKSREDTPTNAEVIDSNTLNFRSNFKFSRLKFSRTTPAPLGCLVNLYSTCKNFMAQHLLRGEIYSPKNAFK